MEHQEYSKTFLHNEKRFEEIKKHSTMHQGCKKKTASWQKALNNASITNTEMLKSHEFLSSKTLHPQFQDKKFRLLCRKT